MAHTASLTIEASAQMLGLCAADIATKPVWVNTGICQLLIEVTSKGVVLSAQPDPILFKRGAALTPNRIIAYLWHGAHGAATVRYFSMKNGSITEDSGTGSACANLGGLQLLRNNRPINWTVTQGHALERINTLELAVSATQEIWVGSACIYVGQSQLSWPLNEHRCNY